MSKRPSPVAVINIPSANVVIKFLSHEKQTDTPQTVPAAGVTSITVGSQKTSKNSKRRSDKKHLRMRKRSTERASAAVGEGQDTVEEIQERHQENFETSH
jgi:uncharacterized protein YhfF